jgi:hypothetical protein
MLATLELKEATDYGLTVYLARRGSEWCEVSTWGSLRLTSFIGSHWPAQFPEFFAHYGPDAGMITGRSGYAFREDITLPTR